MKQAYLTIDDSPTIDFKHKVNFLLEKNIPCVFFCEGQRILDFMDDVITAITKGFAIENHSWNHPDFDTLTQEEIRSQIVRTDTLIDELYHRAGIIRDQKLFRFPYLRKGAENKSFAQSVLEELGYTQPHFSTITYEWYQQEGFQNELDVVCTYDSMDWTVANGSHMFGIKNLQDLLMRMDENEPEGRRGLNYPYSNEIIMMHDIPSISSCFNPMIERLLEKGIKFCPIPGRMDGRL